MKMNSKTYDILKKIALVWLPALAALSLAVCQIWGLPYGEPIAQTITAIQTFLGILLGISTKNYWESPEALEEMRVKLNGELANINE